MNRIEKKKRGHIPHSKTFIISYHKPYDMRPNNETYTPPKQALKTELTHVREYIRAPEPPSRREHGRVKNFNEISHISVGFKIIATMKFCAKFKLKFKLC